jgi:hypothetical protein
MTRPTIALKTPSEEWYEDIFANHYEGARQRALSLLEQAEEDENGCLVTNTAQPRKLRFAGGQDRAYRFVFYVLSGRVPYAEEVVRHLCHNRHCINPAHLAPGERADNLEDDRRRDAYGVDFDWL